MFKRIFVLLFVFVGGSFVASLIDASLNINQSMGVNWYIHKVVYMALGIAVLYAVQNLSNDSNK